MAQENEDLKDTVLQRVFGDEALMAISALRLPIC